MGLLHATWVGPHSRNLQWTLVRHSESNDLSAITGVLAADHHPEPLTRLHTEAIRVSEDPETVRGRVHSNAWCARKNSAVAPTVRSMSSSVCAAVMYPRSM